MRRADFFVKLLDALTDMLGLHFQVHVIAESNFHIAYSLSFLIFI